MNRSIVMTAVAIAMMGVPGAVFAGLPAYAWWRRHQTPDSGEQP